LKVAVFPVIVTAPATEPPVLLRRNDVPFTDAASTASENVAVTFAFGSIPVAPFAGLNAVIVGGVTSGSARVMKVHTKSDARWFPAWSSTPVVTRAVNVVLYARGLDGLNVAVCPESVTVPVTAPAPPLRRKVAVFTDVSATGSENVARTVVAGSTPVAPFGGTIEVTTGPVTSGAGLVVKLHTNSVAMLLPATSSTPVVTRAVYVVWYARDDDGVKVAVWPDKVTVPAMTVAPAFRRNVDVLKEAGAIGSEKSTRTVVVGSTLEDPVKGRTETTLGGVSSGGGDVENVQT
jgi:hypothetical protein